MNILVCNDDGVLAPGLRTLASSLSEIAQVVVVAPDRDRSAASHSLTIDFPIRYQKLDNGYFSVSGTPTDCVHLAITGDLIPKPDMVVSGINAGSNLGDDVLYSGTVAAAIEGRSLGFATIAISLASELTEGFHYDTAGFWIRNFVKNLMSNPLPRDSILNINIPDLPIEEIKGVQTTRLGCRHKAEKVIKSKDPRGHDIYWVGPVGAADDAGPGTDFYAVTHGYVSITPLKCDLTDNARIPLLEKWCQNI